MQEIMDSPGIIASPSASAKPPRYRTRWIAVNESRLQGRLAENAKLKSLAIPYKWDGSHIVRATTSTAFDVHALIASTHILGPIMEEAPNGYPALQGLVRVWINLNNKYDTSG